jgi:hypothetical protein
MAGRVRAGSLVVGIPPGGALGAWVARVIKLDGFMVKRVKRAKGKQEKHAPCIICKRSFDDCPHSYADIDKVVNAVELAGMLRIEIP